MTERKTNVKVADMSPEMQTEAIDIATKAIKEHQMETDIAAHIKKEFDKRYFPTWQCIVGRNFGADVEHEAKGLFYFYIGQLSVLIWRAN
ncbi:dynein light chain LC8-type [Strigomonas culicis]|uniref:Dynein light chain n=2 Tax=Strigomonas culicis TaxID=28005 RepID=S9W7E1_9TRYP|nr:dynein light chain LC8-type [Strigomonas culicis]|eukprot:EPY35116.1 dynein light chain LC8-type [Strigomonas culicis]